MADASIINNIGSSLSFIAPLVLLLFLGIGFAIFIFVIYRMGLLVPRPYKVLVHSSRAGGGWFWIIAKGRYLYQGKEKSSFEIYYKANQKYNAPAPSESLIDRNNVLVCHRNAQDAHVWLDKIEVNEAKLKADPTLDSSLKSIYSQSVKEEAERYTEIKPWLQLIPAISILISIIIIAIAWYVGAENVSKSTADAANTIMASNIQIAEAIRNASIANPTPIQPTLPFTPIS